MVLFHLQDCIVWSLESSVKNKEALIEKKIKKWVSVVKKTKIEIEMKTQILIIGLKEESTDIEKSEHK